MITHWHEHCFEQKSTTNSRFYLRFFCGGGGGEGGNRISKMQNRAQILTLFYIIRENKTIKIMTFTIHPEILRSREKGKHIAIYVGTPPRLKTIIVHSCHTIPLLDPE